MSEIDLNDYKSPEIKVGDQTIQVICRIDVDSLADILVRRTNEQLFHEAATLQGYVKERTCGIWRGSLGSVWGQEDDLELWCEHCDIVLEEDWNYCPTCGAKVVEQ